MDKVLSKLRPVDRTIFLLIHEKHMESMGTDERAKYEGKIKSVKVDRRQQALKVTYENGDWWYYSAKGTWY